MQNKYRGFTLVELLIVIMIIGILATMAVPQYNKMVLRSKLSGMWVTLGALRTAVQMYRAEYGKAPLGENTSFTFLNVAPPAYLNVDLPYDKYDVAWGTKPSESGSTRLDDMNISVNNMAFAISYKGSTQGNQIYPQGLMSEEGKKKYTLGNEYISE